jgi:hypothetical protein
MSGTVYFFSNPAIPGLLKIGYTETSLEQRLSQLRHTAVPANFVVEAAFRVNSALSCERAVHVALKEFRHTAQREFFKVTLMTALTRCWPIIQTHLNGDEEPVADLKTDAHPFPDLTETEERILGTIIDKPPDLGMDWSGIRNEHNFTENETHYYLQELKAKGYLRELKDRNPKYDSDWELAEKGLKYYMWIEGRKK